MKPTSDQARGGESAASITLQEFRAVLARVTDLLDRGDSTQSATAPLAAFIQQRVGCTVVSFWSLLVHNGTPVMSRIGGYDAAANAALHELLVRPASDFDLAELADSGLCIVPRENLIAGSANRASAEAVADDAFFPACIDANIAVNGETFGIIRCEFDGPHRAWRLGETTLLRSFAGEIALRRARRRARRD